MESIIRHSVYEELLSIIQIAFKLICFFPAEHYTNGLRGVAAFFGWEHGRLGGALLAMTSTHYSQLPAGGIFMRSSSLGRTLTSAARLEREVSARSW